MYFHHNILEFKQMHLLSAVLDKHFNAYCGTVKSFSLQDSGTA